MSEQLGILNFVLIGAKNSGKTVFLATLYGKEESIIAATKETKQYLQEKWEALKAGGIPPATSGSLFHLEFSLKKDKYAVNFLIDDYDGYFAETLSQDDEHTRKERETLKENIRDAEGLLFFFPYETDFDQETLERFQQEIDTFITLVKEIYSDRRDLPTPVAIVVTKWDRSPHFKSQGEKEKALEYINSVEAFSNSLAKLRNFFANVEVIPISSFGISQDGFRPVKDKITPYNIVKPFLYCLDITFSLFEQRVAELEAKEDKEALFNYLSMIYKDVQCYKDGYLKNKFFEVEKDVCEELICQLKSKRNYQQIKELYKKKADIINNIRTEKYREEIEKILKNANSKQKQTRIKRRLFVLLIVCFVFYSILVAINFNNERNLFLDITTQDTERSPVKVLQLCNDYLAKYVSRSFLLPITDVNKHRTKVQKILNNTRAAILDGIKTKFKEIVKKDIYDPSVLNDLQLLIKETELFPDELISEQIAEYYQQVIEKNNLLRQVDALINKAEVIFTDEVDVSKIDTILNELNEMLPEVDLKDRRQYIIELQNKLSEKKHEIIVSSVVNKAELILQNVDANIDEADTDNIDKVLDELNEILPTVNREDRRQYIIELQNKLSEKKHEIIVNDKYKRLYKEIDELPLEDYREISTLMEKRWDSSFTQEHISALKKLIDKKILEYDKSLINDLKDKFETEDELEKTNEKMRKIYNVRLDIEKIGYYYERPAELKEKVKVIENALDTYNDIKNNGIYVDRLCFGSYDKTNSQMACTSIGVKDDNDVVLTFGSIKLKQEDGLCETDDKIISICWQFNTKLKAQWYDLRVIEEDPLNDDILISLRTFQFTVEDLFELYNRGRIEKHFGQYFLQLFR